MLVYDVGEGGILYALLYIVELPLVCQVLAYFDALEALVYPIVRVTKTLVVHHGLLDAQLGVLHLINAL